MHCNKYRPQPLTRRDLLKGSGIGFGAFAFNSLIANEVTGSNGKGDNWTHQEAKANTIIF